MCDYSLHTVASRAAEPAETLVVTGFPGTSTRGFASPNDLAVAVCLRAGTEIAFEEEACREGPLFRKKIGERLARFRQVDLDSAIQHHDALEFSDGTIVKLTDLVVGQRAQILQMPADPKPAKEEARPELAEIVVA
jgi:hypothetical protein